MRKQKLTFGGLLMASTIAGAIVGLTGCVGNIKQQAAFKHDASVKVTSADFDNAVGAASRLAPGSLVISRPAPAVILASSDSITSAPSAVGSSQEFTLPENALGFVSLPEKVALAPAKGSLTISRSTGQAHLVTSTQDRWLEGVSVSESNEVPPSADSPLSNAAFSSCQISLKQEDPAWYAPDSYYQRRQMEVPAANDGSRYLRGVYGDQALFCDATNAIHSSPAGLDEVGGIKIADEDLALVYQSLEIGDIITITE